jgi:hypothetical protein
MTKGGVFSRNVELGNWVYGNLQITILFTSRLMTRKVKAAE